MDLQWSSGGIGYLGRFRGSASTQEKDSYDKTKVLCFFNPVVANNNTDKVVERIKCDNREDVKHVISKAFQCVHV